MARSAFLPDSETLLRLIEGLTAPSAPRSSLEPLPVSRPSLSSVAGAARLAGSSRAGSAPPASDLPALDEALLLHELDLQLEGSMSLERRFASLCTWLEVRTNSSAVFVADAEGLAVTDARGHERYVAVTSEIALVLKRLSSIAPDLGQGLTTLSLESGESLALLMADTELGKFSVGILGARGLAPVWTTVIQKALRRVATRHEQ